jgi:hypothetical protein
MCAIVFGHIKMRYSPKLRWFVLMPLIFKVDISMPLEVQVDVTVLSELQVDVSPLKAKYH